MHVSKVNCLYEQECQDLLKVVSAVDSTHHRILGKVCVHEDDVKAANRKDCVVAERGVRVSFDTLV